MNNNATNSSQSLKGTFNQVSEMYDKMRPTYVKELYQDILITKKLTKKVMFLK